MKYLQLLKHLLDCETQTQIHRLRIWCYNLFNSLFENEIIQDFLYNSLNPSAFFVQDMRKEKVIFLLPEILDEKKFEFYFI